MKIVTISDTHMARDKITLPKGDMLIHAGDHTFKGTEKEIEKALAWMEEQDFKYKLLTPGNHDWFFDPNAPSHYRGWDMFKSRSVEEMMAKFPSLTLLLDSSVTIEGLKIYGSPWQPWFYDWAFNFRANVEYMNRYSMVIQHDEEQAKAKWAEIPDDVNILITHSPPRGILDATYPNDERQGCPQLLARVQQLENLRLHVFGHLHESYGQIDYESEDHHKITFVNAAIMTREYEPLNQPIVVEI